MQLYVTPIIQRDLVGNPDLKPERATTIELEIGGHPFDMLNLNVSFFYTTIQDYIRPFNIYPSKPTNALEVMTLGVDAEGILAWGNLTAYLNLSWQKTTLQAQALGDLTSIKENDGRLFPDIMLKFGINYRLPRWFVNLNLESEYLGRRLSSEENSYDSDPVNREPYPLSPYAVLHATISSLDLKLIPLGETKLQIKARNIFNEIYYYPGFNRYDIPCLGRQLMLTLGQSF